MIGACSLLALLAALGGPACGGDDGSPTDTSAEADAEADVPAEAEAEAEAEADAEADVPAEAEAEAEAEAGADGDADADVPSDGPTDCIPPETPALDFAHYAGQNCMTCHTATSRTRLTVAGTLYDSLGGAGRVAGATIVVVGGDGAEVRIVTADNGNFYTLTPVVFPATVRASKCPDEAAMVAPVSNGGCNGCHGAANRIHLP
jgi:hypothetical protein